MELMGVKEVAAYLDLPAYTVTRWAQSGRLPKPTAQLATGPVWRARQITEWKQANDADTDN